MPRNSRAPRMRMEQPDPDPAWSEWSAPVLVRLGAHRRVAIKNPAEALSLLTNRWPGRRSDEYLRARHLASEFLRRRATREEVRDAFVTAVSAEGFLD